MNSDPLLDFPAPRSSRVIDIGGISVSFGHSMLNEVNDESVSYLSPEMTDEWFEAKVPPLWNHFETYLILISDYVYQKKLFMAILSHSENDTFRNSIDMNRKENSFLQTWSAILDLRPTTVLLSFGTFVQSHAMPERLA